MDREVLNCSSFGKLVRYVQVSGGYSISSISFVPIKFFFFFFFSSLNPILRRFFFKKKKMPRASAVLAFTDLCSRLKLCIRYRFVYYVYP